MRLFRILVEPYLLEAQLVDLFFKLTVLRPYPAQIKIVMPEITAIGLAPDQATFQRSNCSHRPHSNQPGRFSIAGALDLHRQPKHLQKQHAHQNDQVAVTAEDGFHNISGQWPVISGQLAMVCRNRKEISLPFRLAPDHWPLTTAIRSKFFSAA